MFNFKFAPLLCATIAISMLAVPASAQLSGSVFTSTVNGGSVNANIYNLRIDVYVNGGPQNQNSSGLPNGTYYYQVTDPSGGTLLSTDNAECRQLQVLSGRVAGAVGPCPHANGVLNPLNGSIPVQLAPFELTPNPGGEYKLWLIAQSSVVASCSPTIDTVNPVVINFTNNCSKTDNFKVKEHRESEPELVTISGYKWYDSNLDGVKNGTEQFIPGWRIEKTPPNTADVTYTDAGGMYGYLLNPNSGIYTITEVLPGIPKWVNTTPLSGNVNVGSTNVQGPNFGNVCLGAGGGLTLGFWSNKNGQSLIGADDLLMLRNLPLVNADGSAFDPTTAAQVNVWLLNGNAVNMAYMLSVQLTAMELNVFNGKVSGAAMVYAPGVPGANAFGFISINDLMAAAVAELTAHPVTSSSGNDRSHQETIKTALDNANNNYIFVQPTLASCPFTSPY